MSNAVEFFCCLLLLFSGTTGIVLDKSAVLLSTDPQASCSQYSTVVCEPDLTQTLPNIYDIDDYDNNVVPGPYCPNGNCLNQIPSPLTYQLIHSNSESDKIVVRLKWDLIIQDGCQVHEYYVLVMFSKTFDNSKMKNCSHISVYPLLFTLSNSSTEINLESNFPDNYHYYVKVIAYPIYEWPTKYIEVPEYCTNSNFPTCQNCGCTPVTDPPSDVSIIAVVTPYNTISANVSWLPSSGTTEYFLHINSTISGKKLYRLGQVSEVIINDIPNDEETYVWLEQFSCGCSNSTPVYSLSDALNVTSTNPPSPMDIISPSSSSYPSTHSFSPSLSSSFLSTSTITPPTNYSSSGYSITHSFSPPLSSSFLSTSTITPPTNYSSSGYSITHSFSPSLSSSFLSTITITSPTNHTLNTTISPLIYIPPLVVFLVIIILITTIFAIILMARRRKKPIYPNLEDSNSTIRSQYLHPQVICPPTTLSQLVKPQPKVISVIAHNTPQSDKEPYLAYLDDLREHYGIQVLTYDRVERITPAEWLCKSLECIPKPVVLIVINKQFYQEWNASCKAEIPLVFALQQLILSLLQQSQGLQNFALILPTSSDKKYIPSGYLHATQQFELQDTQGISRFILNVREYTVDCSYL